MVFTHLRRCCMGVYEMYDDDEKKDVERVVAMSIG